MELVTDEIFVNHSFKFGKYEYTNSKCFIVRFVLIRKMVKKVIFNAVDIFCLLLRFILILLVCTLSLQTEHYSSTVLITVMN